MITKEAKDSSSVPWLNLKSALQGCGDSQKYYNYCRKVLASSIASACWYALLYCKTSLKTQDYLEPLRDKMATTIHTAVGVVVALQLQLPFIWYSPMWRSTISLWYSPMWRFTINCYGYPRQTIAMVLFLFTISCYGYPRQTIAMVLKHRRPKREAIV